MSEERLDFRTIAEDEAFEECWAAYPRRYPPDAKKVARKAWLVRVRKKEATAAELLEATRRYARYCDAEKLTGTRLVMMAATFYGPQGRWEPYLTLEPKPEPRDPVADEMEGLWTGR